MSKKFLFLLVMGMLLITNANAAEDVYFKTSEEIGKEIDKIVDNPLTDTADYDYSEEDLIDAEKKAPDENKFHYNINQTENYSEDDLKTWIPQCDDSRLLELIKHHLQAYHHRNPPESVIERRRQKLLIKRVEKFEPLSPETITSKIDTDLANEVIDIKINKGVPSINMTICKGPKNTDNSYLYVIVYAKDGNIMGKIINFAHENVRARDLEFVY